MSKVKTIKDSPIKLKLDIDNFWGVHIMASMNGKTYSGFRMKPEMVEPLQELLDEYKAHLSETAQ